MGLIFAGLSDRNLRKETVWELGSNVFDRQELHHTNQSALDTIYERTGEHSEVRDHLSFRLHISNRQGTCIEPLYSVGEPPKHQGATGLSETSKQSIRRCLKRVESRHFAYIQSVTGFKYGDTIYTLK